MLVLRGLYELGETFQRFCLPRVSLFACGWSAAWAVVTWRKALCQTCQRKGDALLSFHSEFAAARAISQAFGASCLPCCSFQSGTFLSGPYHHTFEGAHQVPINVTLSLKLDIIFKAFLHFKQQIMNLNCCFSFHFYRIPQCSPELKPFSSALGSSVCQQGLSQLRTGKSSVQVERAVENVLERLG